MMMNDATILLDPFWWLGVAVGSLIDPVLVVLAFIVSFNTKYPIRSRWIFAIAYPMLTFAWKAGYGDLSLGDYYALLPKSLACWTFAFIIFSVNRMWKRKKAASSASSIEQDG